MTEYKDEEEHDIREEKLFNELPDIDKFIEGDSEFTQNIINQIINSGQSDDNKLVKLISRLADITQSDSFNTKVDDFTDTSFINYLSKRRDCLPLGSYTSVVTILAFLSRCDKTCILIVENELVKMVFIESSQEIHGEDLPFVFEVTFNSIKYLDEDDLLLIPFFEMSAHPNIIDLCIEIVNRDQITPIIPQLSILISRISLDEEKTHSALDYVRAVLKGDPTNALYIFRHPDIPEKKDNLIYHILDSIEYLDEQQTTLLLEVYSNAVNCPKIPTAVRESVSLDWVFDLVTSTQNEELRNSALKAMSAILQRVPEYGIEYATPSDFELLIERFDNLPFKSACYMLQSIFILCDFAHIESFSILSYYNIFDICKEYLLRGSLVEEILLFVLKAIKHCMLSNEKEYILGKFLESGFMDEVDETNLDTEFHHYMDKINVLLEER